MKEAPIERPGLPVQSDPAITRQAAGEMNAHIDTARQAAERVGGNAYSVDRKEAGDHVMIDTLTTEEMRDPNANPVSAHRLNVVTSTGFRNTQQVAAHADTHSMKRPSTQITTASEYTAVHNTDDTGRTEGVANVYRTDKAGNVVYKHKFRRPETAARFAGLIAKQLTKKLDVSESDEEKVA